jgi:cobalt-zinc-cadmium efflux system protein
MQVNPSGVNENSIKTELERLPEIDYVHSIMICKTNNKGVYINAHINLQEDIKMSEVMLVREKVEMLLYDLFGIEQSTLQMGYTCQDKYGGITAL